MNAGEGDGVGEVDVTDPALGAPGSAALQPFVFPVEMEVEAGVELEVDADAAAPPHPDRGEVGEGATALATTAPGPSVDEGHSSGTTDGVAASPPLPSRALTDAAEDVSTTAASPPPPRAAPPAASESLVQLPPAMEAMSPHAAPAVGEEEASPTDVPTAPPSTREAMRSGGGRGETPQQEQPQRTEPADDPPSSPSNASQAVLSPRPAGGGGSPRARRAAPPAERERGGGVERPPPPASPPPQRGGGTERERERGQGRAPPGSPVPAGSSNVLSPALGVQRTPPPGQLQPPAAAQPLPGLGASSPLLPSSPPRRPVPSSTTDAGSRKVHVRDSPVAAPSDPAGSTTTTSPSASLRPADPAPRRRSMISERLSAFTSAFEKNSEAESSVGMVTPRGERERGEGTALSPSLSVASATPRHERDRATPRRVMVTSPLSKVPRLPGPLGLADGQQRTSRRSMKALLASFAEGGEQHDDHDRAGVPAPHTADGDPKGSVGVGVGGGAAGGPRSGSAHPSSPSTADHAATSIDRRPTLGQMRAGSIAARFVAAVEQTEVAPRTPPAAAVDRRPVAARRGTAVARDLAAAFDAQEQLALESSSRRSGVTPSPTLRRQAHGGSVPPSPLVGIAAAHGGGTPTAAATTAPADYSFATLSAASAGDASAGTLMRPSSQSLRSLFEHGLEHGQPGSTTPSGAALPMRAKQHQHPHQPPGHGTETTATFPPYSTVSPRSLNPAPLRVSPGGALARPAHDPTSIAARWRDVARRALEHGRASEGRTVSPPPSGVERLNSVHAVVRTIIKKLSTEGLKIHCDDIADERAVSSEAVPSPPLSARASRGRAMTVRERGRYGHHGGDATEVAALTTSHSHISSVESRYLATEGSVCGLSLNTIELSATQMQQQPAATRGHPQQAAGGLDAHDDDAVDDDTASLEDVLDHAVAAGDVSDAVVMDGPAAAAAGGVCDDAGADDCPDDDPALASTASVTYPVLPEPVVPAGDLQASTNLRTALAVGGPVDATDATPAAAATAAAAARGDAFFENPPGYESSAVTTATVSQASTMQVGGEAPPGEPGSSPSASPQSPALESTRGAVDAPPAAGRSPASPVSPEPDTYVSPTHVKVGASPPFGQHLPAAAVVDDSGRPGAGWEVGDDEACDAGGAVAHAPVGLGEPHSSLFSSVVPDPGSASALAAAVEEAVYVEATQPLLRDPPPPPQASAPDAVSAAHPVGESDMQIHQQQLQQQRESGVAGGGDAGSGPRETASTPLHGAAASLFEASPLIMDEGAVGSGGGAGGPIANYGDGAVVVSAVVSPVVRSLAASDAGEGSVGLYSHRAGHSHDPGDTSQPSLPSVRSLVGAPAMISPTAAGLDRFQSAAAAPQRASFTLLEDPRDAGPHDDDERGYGQHRGAEEQVALSADYSETTPTGGTPLDVGLTASEAAFVAAAACADAGGTPVREAGAVARVGGEVTVPTPVAAAPVVAHRTSAVAAAAAAVGVTPQQMMLVYHRKYGGLSAEQSAALAAAYADAQDDAEGTPNTSSPSTAMVTQHRRYEGLSAEACAAIAAAAYHAQRDQGTGGPRDDGDDDDDDVVAVPDAFGGTPSPSPARGRPHAAGAAPSSRSRSGSASRAGSRVRGAASPKSGPGSRAGTWRRVASGVPRIPRAALEAAVRREGEALADGEHVVSEGSEVASTARGSRAPPAGMSSRSFGTVGDVERVASQIMGDTLDGDRADSPVNAAALRSTRRRGTTPRSRHPANARGLPIGNGGADENNEPHAHAVPRRTSDNPVASPTSRNRMRSVGGRSASGRRQARGGRHARDPHDAGRSEVEDPVADAAGQVEATLCAAKKRSSHGRRYRLQPSERLTLLRAIAHRRNLRLPIDDLFIAEAAHMIVACDERRRGELQEHGGELTFTSRWANRWARRHRIPEALANPASAAEGGPDRAADANDETLMLTAGRGHGSGFSRTASASARKEPRRRYAGTSDPVADDGDTLPMLIASGTFTLSSHPGTPYNTHTCLGEGRGGGRNMSYSVSSSGTSYTDSDFDEDGSSLIGRGDNQQPFLAEASMATTPPEAGPLRVQPSMYDLELSTAGRRMPVLSPYHHSATAPPPSREGTLRRDWQPEVHASVHACMGGPEIAGGRGDGDDGDGPDERRRSTTATAASGEAAPARPRSLVQQLEELFDMRRRGALAHDEFTTAKALLIREFQRGGDGGRTGISPPRARPHTHGWEGPAHHPQHMDTSLHLASGLLSQHPTSPSPDPSPHSTPTRPLSSQLPGGMLSVSAVPSSAGRPPLPAVGIGVAPVDASNGEGGTAGGENPAVTPSTCPPEAPPSFGGDGGGVRRSPARGVGRRETDPMASALTREGRRFVFSVRYRNRLMDFFHHYRPDKLPSVMPTVRHAGEADVMAALVRKYGPEPSFSYTAAPLVEGWVQAESSWGDVFYRHRSGEKRWTRPYVGELG